MSYIRSPVVVPAMALATLLKRFLTPLGFGPESGTGSGGERSRTVERTVEPVPGAPVRVSNVNGGVLVEPAEGDDLEVHAVVSANGRRGSVDAAEVRVFRDADGVTVEVEQDDGGFLSGDGASVELTVRIPEGVSLASAGTVNGELLVRDVAGDAHLESVNGGVTATDVDGRLDVETVNGSVEAENVRGLRRVESTNGSVDVAVSELEGDLTAETTTGSVTVRVPSEADPRLELHSTLGSTSVEGLAGDHDGRGPTVRASATTGSITVRGE
jgi:hypothetical protein